MTKNLGLTVGALPAKNIPLAIDRLAKRFVRERGEYEDFPTFVDRVGRRELKALLADLLVAPEYCEGSAAHEFAVGDFCEGGSVSVLELGLAAAEREVFEAQLLLQKKDHQRAASSARHAMFIGARALIRTELKEISADEEVLLTELKSRFIDLGRIGDHARFIYKRMRPVRDAADAQRRIDEAQLFLEAIQAVE